MDAPEPPSVPAPPPAGVSLDGCRVLLVEDHPADAYVYKTVLTRAGANVSAVSTGPLAVAAVGSGLPFHVVVLDLVLPGMRGTEVSAVLRSRGFDGAIVGVSAFLTDELADLWLAAGCDAVLRKDDGPAGIVRGVAAACGTNWRDRPDDRPTPGGGPGGAGVA